jgi:hypothetical protein
MVGPTLLYPLKLDYYEKPRRDYYSSLFHSPVTKEFFNIETWTAAKE